MMLERLEVQDFALLQRAELLPGPHFTVLTGETGAGKSLLMGALDTLRGAKVQKERIRTGADSARVEAMFLASDLTEELREHLGLQEEEECILSREWNLEGKSVARLNGRMLPVARLKELGSVLITMHGQREGQKLFDEQEHRNLLLRYAQLRPDWAQVHAQYLQAWKHWKQCKAELQGLGMSEEKRQEWIELLRFQSREIERVQPQQGEEETLQKKRSRLLLYEKVGRGLFAALRSLDTDFREEGAGALIGLRMAQSELHAIAPMGARISELADALEEICLGAEEITQRLRNMVEQISFEPDALETLERRLDQLSRLNKKYGGSSERVLQHWDQIQRRLQALEDLEGTLKKAQQTLDRAEQQLLEVGEQWREILSQAGTLLADTIHGHLSDLDMPGARFSVRLRPRDVELADGSGLDDCTFVLSANPGEEARPLARVASGGEAARILLAIHCALQEIQETRLMVFDEIDAGISGETSARVGEKLLQLSRSAQVLCVTHSAYLASLADTHYRIYKETHEGRTQTKLTRLTREESREELARLLAGDTDREAAEQLAASLMQRADQLRACGLCSD